MSTRRRVTVRLWPEVVRALPPVSLVSMVRAHVSGEPAKRPAANTAMFLTEEEIEDLQRSGQPLNTAINRAILTQLNKYLDMQKE